MEGQMTIDGKTEAPAVKAAKKKRSRFAACPNCGGTHFIEEQFPAYLYWKCRIDPDGYAVNYSRTPEIDGDPHVLSYACASCSAEYDCASDVVRSVDDDGDDEDEESWS
jgi:DNA-directed RNA polymerase subunit RPC12/RpoP